MSQTIELRHRLDLLHGRLAHERKTLAGVEEEAPLLQVLVEIDELIEAIERAMFALPKETSAGALSDSASNMTLR